jgi:dTDP-4-dehydrorhamnose 3,5-epimerase
MINRTPFLTPLRRIATPGGDVMHAIKAVEDSFVGFGEAYFSTVEMGAVKGWKRHNQMTLNLVVPVGAVEFIVHDPEAAEEQRFRCFTIGPDENYARLTVPPGLWMAFTGRKVGLNLVLNVASIGHDPDEADRADLDAFPWTFA